MLLFGKPYSVRSVPPFPQGWFHVPKAIINEFRLLKHLIEHEAVLTVTIPRVNNVQRHVITSE